MFYYYFFVFYFVLFHSSDSMTLYTSRQQYTRPHSVVIISSKVVVKRRPRCSTTTRGPCRGGGVGGRREGRVFLTGARISAAGSSTTVKSAVTGYYRVTGNADRRRVAAMGFVCTVTALSDEAAVRAGSGPAGVFKRLCARSGVLLMHGRPTTTQWLLRVHTHTHAARICTICIKRSLLE